MTVSAGSTLIQEAKSHVLPEQFLNAALRVFKWLEDHDYKGYDTFDGLSARFLRPFTFNNKYLNIVLQQAVRRLPINLRPLLGIRPERATKAMGFIAKGFLRLHSATNDERWAEKARQTLQWLEANTSPGYSGACWGNHFDYQSRSSYFPKGLPTIVWSSLIGHAFLDAYQHFDEPHYLEVADSVCRHIVKDIDRYPDGDTLCISYVPGLEEHVHNANTLGGSILARVWQHTKIPQYLDIATRSLKYTAKYQRADGSWFYGETSNLHWVDNFHTAYVLDCFKYYANATGDDQFDACMMKGYGYWRDVFFLSDGTPRYYNHKTLPLDIQCCSQAIDSLLLFSDRDEAAIPLAAKVAQWTLANMQDRKDGHFYYRRYNSWLVNTTPTLHWGQATMFCALSGLFECLK